MKICSVVLLLRIIYLFSAIYEVNEELANNILFFSLQNSDVYIKTLLCLLRIAEKNRFFKVGTWQNLENEINGNFSLPTDHSYGDSVNSINFNSVLSENITVNESVNSIFKL